MVDLSRGMVERRITSILSLLATEEPVIALHGPRSVGKSTVLASFARAHGVPVIDLDDPATREAVAANVASAVGQHTPVCLDEYQLVPELLEGLKARLNREGAAENLLPSLRVDPDAAVAAHPTSDTTRAGYVNRVCAGGFPLALRRREGATRNRWFDDYVKQSIERDALELTRVRRRQLLLELLGRLAGRTGQVLNLSAAGDGLALSRSTMEEHTRLLEDLFLLERLPGWKKTLRARTVASPKLHVIDSGVAARLMRVSPDKLASLHPTALTEFGNLLETFVVGELRKQVSWLAEPVTVGHWRTHDGDEVDYIVEFDDGSVLAFEVKANERASRADFKGLRSLRELLGGRFIAGVVFSTGARSFNVEDRLFVMPVDRLWRPVR